MHLQHLSVLAFACFIHIANDGQALLSEWVTDFDDNEDDADIAESTWNIEAVLGKTTNFPCDIGTHDREDRVYMVLWFKKGLEKPIYSFDARGRPFSKALRWSDINLFGPRALFITIDYPAHLKIENVQLRDEGIYRCRVDFKNGPTRNFKIELTVIVPPHQMILYDHSGRELTNIVGPLREQSDLTITCEVRGGKPSPRLVWTSEDKILQNYTEVMNNVAICRLKVHSISREMLNRKFMCVASNTDLTAPTKRSVTLDMDLLPLYIKFIDKPTELRANEMSILRCITEGSRPPAIISWIKKDVKINAIEEDSYGRVRNSSSRGEGGDVINKKVNGDAVTATHSVKLIPKPEDNGLWIKCRAANPKINDFHLEDTFKLNVVFAPIIQLKLGTNLDTENIKEGDDVYFECLVVSNPPENKIVWYHNGIKVMQNISAGIIISSYNLVLQLIKKTSSGFYTCSVTNSIDTTISQTQYLRVKYPPVCINLKPMIIGASLGETVNVECDVMADPSKLIFNWIFNNSDGHSFMVPENRHKLINSTSSLLVYTLASDRDYGTLSCWSSNLVGQQNIPCIYNVIPAVPPDIVTNCTIQTITNSSFEGIGVQCKPDHGAGLPQKYHIEIKDNTTLLANMTNDAPLFFFDVSKYSEMVKLLLLLAVYASNKKGISEKTFLEYSIIYPQAEKNAELMVKDPPSTRYTTFFMFSTLIIGTSIGVFIFVIFRLRKRYRKYSPRTSSDQTKKVHLKYQRKSEHSNKLSYQIQVCNNKPDILDRANSTSKIDIEESANMNSEDEKDNIKEASSKVCIILNISL